MLHKNILGILCRTLVVVFLAGCGSAPAQPTVTVVPPQPTATQTLIPPTFTAVPPTPVETDFIATKPEDIAGEWRFSVFATPWHMDFRTDGSNYSNRVETKDKPLGAKFWFEGTVFYFEDIGCSPDAKQVTRGTYEAHVVQRDGKNYKLYFKLINDSCKERANMMKKGFMWFGPL